MPKVQPCAKKKNCSHRRRMQLQSRLHWLLLCILLGQQQLLHRVSASCRLNEVYFVTDCHSSSAWACREYGNPGQIRYCLFNSGTTDAPKFPAVCAQSQCGHIDPYADSAGRDCLDETMVCKKDFYARGAIFKCGAVGESLNGGNYSGNDGMKPLLPDVFYCETCPPGYFCYGGAIHNYQTFRSITNDGYDVALSVPVMHRPPVMCPFEGMVFNESMPAFPDPCASKAVPCDQYAEVLQLCKLQPQNCPCVCPPNSSTALLESAGSMGGKVCGCLPGTYWDTAQSGGTIRCVPCERNAYCPGGNGIPNYKFTCPMGWNTVVVQGASKLSDCSFCAAGCMGGQYCSLPTSFNDTSNPCKTCPEGHYCAEVKGGQTKAVKCTPGTFQDKDGQASCKACGVGRFSTQEGSTACALCPPGKYQPSEGQTTCISCTAGKHQPAAGQPQCLACQQGTYQAVEGATACTACPAGTVGISGASEGQTSLLGACKVCEEGKFAALKSAATKPELYSCEACAPGAFSLCAALAIVLVHAMLSLI